MYEVGRLAVKIAGRDAGEKCVIVEVLDETYVLVDGMTRRRKCNRLHLEPMNKTLDIKAKASHDDVAKAFKEIGLEVKTTKPKAKTIKPKAAIKTKAKDDKKPVKDKKVKVKAEKVAKTQ